MPRIHTISTDATMNDADMVIGTDGAVNASNATRNYTFGAMKAHFLTDPAVTGNMTVSGNTTIGGNLAVTGTSTFTGDATFNGHIFFGDADTDNLYFNADVKSNIIPDADDEFDLGSATKEWRNIYSDGTAHLDTVDIDGTVQIDGNTTFGVASTSGNPDVKFWSENSSRYMMWDASHDKLIFSENARAQFGTNTSDLAIYNDESESYIDAGTTAGNLYIRNRGDQKDIIFQAEDGEGGTSPSYEEYFRMDGSLSEAGTAGVNYTRWPDKANIALGNVIGGELHGGEITVYDKHFNISHMISPSETEKNINITNYSNDGDIKISTDNGSGGTVNYMVFDGGTVQIINKVDMLFEGAGSNLTWDQSADRLTFNDNGYLSLGTGNDLTIYHNGTDSIIANTTGIMKFSNSDSGIQFDNNVLFPTSISLNFGGTHGSSDLQIEHDGSHSYISEIGTGDLKIQSTSKIDFSIAGTSYFNLFDGTINITRPITVGSAGAHISLPDNAKLNVGTGNDLQIYHDSTHSYIKEAGDGDLRIETTGSVVVKAPVGATGDLEIWADNGSNNSDFWKLTAQTDNVFEIQTKDGGSWAPVMELSASDKKVWFKGDIYVPGDTTLAGNLTVSGSILNPTVNNLIVQSGQDAAAQIELRADAGDNNDDHWRLSAEASATFKILTRDGGTYNSVVDFIASNKMAYFKGDVNVLDSKKLLVGSGSDLQIFHDGSDSYISDTGTGNLIVKGGAEIKILGDAAASDVVYGIFKASGTELWHNGNKKLETSNAGVTVTGTVNVNGAFTIPSSIGTEGQVLKVPASGTALEWGAADSIPHIREGANFGGSLLIGHTTTGTLDNALSNTALGIGVLESITSGDYNVAIGKDAADALTDGDNNVAIGYNALGAITTQNGNVAIGYGAGDTLTDTTHGVNNVFIGANAGGAVADSQGKAVFVGSSAGANNIKGQTVGIGASALSKNEGSGNTAVGYAAGKNNVGGDSNTYIGKSCGEWAEDSTTSNNTLVGAYCGKNTWFEGISNTTLGADAGYMMSTCSSNVLVGKHSGRALKTDSRNVFIGQDTASDNEFVGDENVAVGHNALNNVNHGSAGVDARNVAIGKDSGSSIVTGTQNILLGYDTQPSANNTSNEIVIGYDVTGLGANKAVIGNASTTNIAPGADGTVSLGDDTRGFEEIILTSPNGTKYRVKVADNGTLSTTAV